MENNIRHQNNSMTVHCHIGITSAKIQFKQEKRAITSAQSMAITSAIIIKLKDNII